MAAPSLPPTMKALVCAEAGQPLKLQTVETPIAVPGSVIVKIITAGIDSTLNSILSGKSFFTFPNDTTPGSRAVGRVVATGVDTTSLEVGQLVMLEPFVRARDNPGLQILWGAFDGGSPASKKFAADNWRRAGYAEYCRTPLENCHPLDEKVLCGSPAEGGFGYTHHDLLQLPVDLVAYGGLRSIDLQAGETVLVAPATGPFSGAAIQVAIAMGAKVIAMSRNVEEMKRIQANYPAGRVQIVPNTGNVEADAEALRKFGEIDVYIDISPITAKDSTHVRSAFQALKQYGRASLMGILPDDLAMPYSLAVWKSLTIRGQYMYERDQVRGLIKLAESGALKLGKGSGVEVLGTFKLEEVDKALELSAAHRGYGKLVALTP